MRKLPASLQISAAVHAFIVTWLVSDRPPEEPPPPPAPTIELLAKEPEIVPVDVTFLDPPTTAAIPEARPERTRDVAGAEEAAISAGAASTTGSIDTAGTPGTGEPTPGTTPGKKNPLLDMRKGAPVRLTVGVPTGRWDGRDKAPETYGPDIDTGQLSPDGGGTYRSDEGPFTAKVNRDGSVNLKDKKNFNIRFALPRPRQVGRAVGDWYQDPNKPVGMLPPDKITKAPVINNDEANGQYDRKPDHGDATVPIVSGGFDVTDALMRRNGQDPYASKKLQYLDSTRDQRVQIGQRHRAKQLEQAVVIMKGNLDRVWSLPTPQARRQALFELWDECAETGPAELVAAGRDARKLVVGVIRARIPAGSADAFSAEDLVALNQRKQSKAKFAPYD
ncbi:MAG: hypothetical protein H0T42_24175 [Deltaproteobacteria bacterium]|nr:hypothetical protein [Deltaproteobacteria bacterium]